MNYEDRLIIYIDVLGFSDFVNYTTIARVDQEDKIKKVDLFLNMIRDFFQDKNNSLVLSRTKQVTSFSDLIIVSINLDEIDNIDIEIMEVVYLLLNATYKGFLLRGSIVYGKLIHNKDIIFGSGLIEAYNRERLIAKYPRVIIDKAIVNDLKELSHKKVTFPLEDIISYDNDGLLYIDIFKNMRNYVDSFWEYIQILISLTNILIDIMDNPILQEKYIWLAQKFEEHIEINSDILKYSFDSIDITKCELETFKLFLSEYNDEKYKKIK